MDKLLSVGLDVGTTTTQLVVSKLGIVNRGNAFSVPKMEITEREIVYESPVIFTPLLGGELVDGEAIAHWVGKQYEEAGIEKSRVDTGAVIITGETSRKENARPVLHYLSGFAGDFVVATAGPDLESVLSAKGAGAVDYSEKTGRSVLHMDIGGGTSNLSFIQDGKITATGCLNVGGRLIKFGANGEITYISPVLAGLTPLQVGQTPTEAQLQQVTEILVQTLEMAAGLRVETPLLEKLTTRENIGRWLPQRAEVISFSGGVADCIGKTQMPFAFGDLGVLLGRAITVSALCKMPYRLGEQTIRATVIGAGSHSAHLSGSTVFLDGVALPKKNLPVAVLSQPVTAEAVAKAYSEQDTPEVVLSFPGEAAPSYAQVQALAKTLLAGCGDRPLLVCVEQDMAKALGHAIRLLDKEKPCLCIDRVQLESGSFLDMGRPVGPALPVVVKTLILSQ